MRNTKDRFWEKVNFGTYHHTDFEGSQKTRERVYNLFMNAFEIIGDFNGLALDAGAGMGFLTSLFLLKYRNARVVMVDNFEDESLNASSASAALANLRALELTANAVVSELRCLPFKDGVFDMGISSLTYHNIKEGRDKAFAEMRRVLKKDALFLLGDLFAPEPDGFETLAEFSIEGKYLRGYTLRVLKRK